MTGYHRLGLPNVKEAVVPDYNVLREPRADVFRALVDAATGSCDRFLWVLSGMALKKCARVLLVRLEPFLIGCEDVAEYPGTVLMSGTITTCTYRLDRESGSILRGAADGLYEWVEPDLPQDLCFLWGPEPWLINMASDEEAVLHASEAEVAKLRAAIPGLELAPTRAVG